MILSDSNILASFAAAGQLPLLWRLFNVTTIWIPPAVDAELKRGIERGRIHLSAIQDLLHEGRLRVSTLTAEDQQRITAFPIALGAGEREAIAFCIRTRARLLCNDRRAANFCHEQGVQYLDLTDILRRLWTAGILTRLEIQTMMAEMTRIELHVFKDPQSVFEPVKRPTQKS